MFHRSIALFLLALAPYAARAQTVFINELHYDNTSTDSNERVEVAGPAGTSLAGWSLVLYNGNGGASYATIPLGGTIANTCAGYGAVSVATAGIQNGAPDGVALVDAASTVVQFLSYEGGFTATTGPAAGLPSIDIGAEEDGTGATTTSLQLIGLGSTYVDFDWTEATASMGSCNAGQTFTGGVDSPPGVFQSIPADNATGVSPFADLHVTFTEDVTAAAGWYSLACANSGAVSAAQSGGPRTYTLNPTTNLVPGEACTLTITASQITDLDGMVNAMAADAVIDFTVAPDVAPTVTQTLPAGNANSVPIDSHVVVTFSEPVTVEAGAFLLFCEDSGGHSGAISGGPTVFTFDPTFDLSFDEHCSFQVRAFSVSDLDGAPTGMADHYTIAFDTEQSLADYYATVNASSAAALRATLHAIIDDHTRFPYSSGATDTWDILDFADEDPMNPSRVLDVYKNESYPKAGAGNANYNREHRWAKSFGFPDDTSSSWAYTDTHHLIVSNSGYNSARNNRYFDNCLDACTEYPTTLTNGFGGGSGTYPGNSNWGKGERWETWNYRKGDVARSMFYMDVRYEGGTNGAGHPEPDLVLTDDPLLIQTTGVNTTGTAYLGLRAVLIQWHQQDPPDALEEIRNDIIQSYQGNRNPFVDHPEWVACVFQGVCGAPVNQPPVFANVSATINENTPAGTLMLVLLAQDPDAGQTLTYTLISGNESGAFALAPNGELSIANSAQLDFESGTSFSLVVRATDNGSPALSDDATVAFALANVEEGIAIAQNDTRVVAEDSDSTGLNVTSNDTPDPDTGELTISIAQLPQHGVASVVGNDIVYAPDANYCGSDLIIYVANDTFDGNADAATVTIDVTCVEDPPVAFNDAGSMVEDTGTVVVDVLNNDVDTDGYGLAIHAYSTPQHGTTSLTQEGLVYQPFDNFCGSDSFTYTLGGGSVATVAISVTCVNDLPWMNLEGFSSVPESVSLGQSFRIDDVDSTLSCTTSLTATSDNQTLLPNSRIEFRQDGDFFCLVIFHVEDFQVGVANVTVTLSDGQAQIQQQYVVTVFEADADNDLRLDEDDNCPTTPNFDQADGDVDGIGDACDPFPADSLRIFADGLE